MKKENSNTSIEDVEASAAFWHMCDLIWIILFPIIYLLFNMQKTATITWIVLLVLTLAAALFSKLESHYIILIILSLAQH